MVLIRRLLLSLTEGEIVRLYKNAVFYLSGRKNLLLNLAYTWSKQVPQSCVTLFLKDVCMVVPNIHIWHVSAVVMFEVVIEYFT